MKTLSTISFILLTISALSQSPLVFNQGSIYNDGLIYVNGNWENQHNGTQLTNKGEINLRGDDNPGDFIINDSAQIQGSGVYRLDNNWENSGVFISDSSEVYLDGAYELIMGDSITRYFDLILEGSGVKTQLINAEVKHQLNLNNLELSTQNFEMYVSNSWDSAIVHQSGYMNEGLVSSVAGGLLVRKTDSVHTYFFPVGSKVNGHQFRPVTLENLSLNDEKVGVRMIPEDATANGLDRDQKDNNICFINDGYYHEITSTDADQSNISIYYDPNLEPSWNILAQWNTPISNLWNELNSNSSTLYGYSGRLVNNHSDFSNDYYALGYFNEISPEIYGDTIICDTTEIFTYSTDNYDVYDWEASNNGYSFSSSSQEIIGVQWPNSSGNQLSLTVTDSYGCVSPPAVLDIDVNHLSAGFDTLSGYGVGNFLFNNTSIGANQFEWTIGDFTSNEENISYTFPDVGDYEIQLIVSNDLGCLDTISENLRIPALFWVPNVFTPNGEPGNELFYIDAIGVKEYTLQIYDRWGLLLYESSDYPWDGTNQKNNQPVSAGTYYFIYTATDVMNEKHQYAGPLSLFR